MRELHVVALSEDGGSVLLATTRDATRGGFRVAVDDRLAAAVRGDLPRPGEQLVRDSTLTPAQIQSRLRAGASAEQIAREAGVPVARVERFSGPVLSERARVIDAAGAAHLVRGRLGRSVLPMGAAVTAALEGSSGYREDSEDWTTRREEDGRWTVTVSWFARARIHTASWTWDPSGKVLLAVDPAAAALGHVPEQSTVPRRTPRTAVPATAEPRPKAGRRVPPSRTAAPSRVTKPSATAAPSRVTKPSVTAAPSRVTSAAKPQAAKVAKPVPKARAVPKAQAVPKTRAAPTTEAAPTTKAGTTSARGVATAQKVARTLVTDAQATSTRKPARKSALTPALTPALRPNRKPARTPVKTEPATGRSRPRSVAGRLRVVPNPELLNPELPTPPEPSAPAAQPPQARVARGRASVPGWADVLLGTAPRRDEPRIDR